jgi:glycosyltransferase involved in cell wall biosynthesis
MSIKRRKKILYIDDTGRLGGAQISLLGLLANLSKSCFDPVLLCRNDGPLLPKAKNFGIETKPAGWGGLRNPLGFVKDLVFLFSLIKRRKIELLHINSSFLFKYGALLSFVMSIPAVGHMRDISILSGAGRWYFNRLNHVIAISESVADSLAKSHLKTPVSIIYNGVDLDTFHPSLKKRQEFRQKYNILENEIVVGICSRIAPEKGQDTFVKAASLVSQENRKIRFIIAGDAIFDRNRDYKNKIKSMAKDLGVQPNIVWTGFVEKTEELFAALDILVVASIAEPFGRVAIEAGACGLPVIGSASGGIPEIVLDDQTGILLPPQNAVQLAHAILKLSENGDKRIQLGRQAASRISANFSLKRHVAAVEELYFQLLGP